MPVQFAFFPVRKERGRRVVSNTPAPLDEIKSIIYNSKKEYYDAKNAERRELIEQTDRERRDTGEMILIANEGCDAVDFDLFLITGIGDKACNSKRNWNGREFKKLMERCNANEAATKLYKDLLHDKYEYHAWRGPPRS